MSEITKKTTTGEVARSRAAAFLEAVKARDKTPGARGRLIFALDATASRQPTWDTACRLQADMFEEAMISGGLDVQLVYYRGLGECQASRWKSSARDLAAIMERIDCRGGETQIRKILAHAKRETQIAKVHALAFVGDAMEGDKLDELCHVAGELGRLSVPCFMFQEGDDQDVEHAFREIARLTHGAYHRFDPGAAHELGELLRAVATYAVGGKDALKLSGTASATKLLSQLK